jgi:hypothetical protein
MWQPVAFRHPGAVDDIASGIAGHLTASRAAMDGGAQALQGLGLPDAPPPAGGADAARAGAGALLSSRARYIAVPPYQHGVGTRRGDHAYLTPQGAIEVIGARLSADSAESLASGELPSLDTGLVLLVLAETEPGRLADALGGFNAVHPIPELRQAERRSRALATIERDKYEIPPAPGYPAWGKAAPERSSTGRATARALGGQVATAEGWEASRTSPTARLGAFRQRRATAEQQRAQALQDLAASMTGTNGAWFGTYLEGAVAVLAPMLTRFAPPLDGACKCCSAVCWYGTKSQVPTTRRPSA